MRGALLFFSGGVVVAHQLSALPPPWLIVAMLFMLAPVLRWPRMRPPLAFLVGIWLAVLTAQGVLDDQLPVSRAGETHELEGRIGSIPIMTDYGAQFVFLPQNPQRADVPNKILVRWYGGPLDLQAGSTWRLRLKLQPPKHQLNPGVHDRERYHLLNRVGAIASVVQNTANRQLAPGRGLHYLRQRLSVTVRRYIADPQAAALGVALSVGDRQYLDSALRERLHSTGTAHLVAISGLHIGLVAGGVWLLSGLLWRLAGHAAGRVPAALAGVFPALVAATFYAALAGFALPTRRALLMVALAFAALLLRRRTSPWTILLLALACVLVLDPLAPLGAGMWLSFGAVAALLWVSRGRPSVGPKYAQYARLQLVLLIALAPLTLLWFGHIAWLAPAANLVAIPFVGSLAVPVLLTGISVSMFQEAVGGFLLAWAGWLLESLDRGLAFLAVLDPETASRAVPPMPLMLFSMAGSFLLLLPRGVPGKLGGIGLLMLPLLWLPPAPPAGRADIFMMDAGHGHAMLVRTREHALLFDTGSSYLSTELHALLRLQGVSKLDRLVLSNARAGSIGGADLLQIPVIDRIGEGQPRRCNEVANWNWDGVHFRFLDREADGLGDCLLSVEAGGDRLLVAHALTPRAGGVLQDRTVDETVTWLVVPQHGHRSGTSRELANLLSPTAVFVPIDRHNRYGLPHPETVAIWEEADADFVQTGHSGAVTLQLGRHHYVTERDQGRYWQQ